MRYPKWSEFPSKCGTDRARGPRGTLALGVLAGVAACQGSAPPADRPLEVLAPTEVATLDPRFSTRSLDIKVTRLVHAGLVGLDPTTLEPIPSVASSFRFASDRTVQVTLRPGVRFHSGRALAAADVCATIAALSDPALRSPHRALVKSIGRCEVTAPRELELTLTEPRATVLTDLEVPILRADEAHLPPRPAGGLDGLGPFAVEQVQDGAITLRPADTGVLPVPRHRVVVRTVRDENARALRLLAGRADVAPNAISPTLLPALERESHLAVRARSGANVTYLLFHNERAPFDQVALRRAAALAIDRETIVKTLLAGRAELASELFPRGHWAHDPGLTPLPFDAATASRAFAGLPAVTLLTSTDRSRVTIARAIAQMLGDAGLDVRVVPLDLGVLLARLDAGDFQVAILQLPELTEPNILTWFFHPSGVPGEGGQGKNRARYRSREAAQLLDLGAHERDPEVRRHAYHELARVMARDLPVVPLWHESQIAVVSRRAQSFEPSAEGRWLGLAAL